MFYTNAACGIRFSLQQGFPNGGDFSMGGKIKNLATNLY